MMNNNNKPVLSIDFKKARIRIHKKTLHLLGDPEYVHLLINPLNRTLAIKCADPKDHLAHRITENDLLSKQCYELHSRELIRSLQTLYYDSKDKRSYRIPGYLITEENMALFKMKDSAPLN